MWGWFLELHSRRPFDGMSGLSQPISWHDIWAWSDVTETPLASHEIRLLTALDDYFLDLERKTRAREQKTATQKSKSKRTR